MLRRHFLFSSAGAACALAAPSTGATVLYDDRTVTVSQVRPDPKDLWVRAADLPRINDFEVKPQGACRADMCIPIPKELRSGPWFNLSGFGVPVKLASLVE